MAKFEPLIKTHYDNADSSDKTIPTPPTINGAWDMEQITKKINELAAFNKSGYDLSKANPTKQYGLKDGVWAEVIGGGVADEYGVILNKSFPSMLTFTQKTFANDFYYEIDADNLSVGNPNSWRR